MGVDLHRIGTGISSGTSRTGFGNIVSFPSVAPSYPAAGTILETLTNETFPIANGGGIVTYNGTQYENQNADVYRKANGTGGNYLDWANAFNLTYKTGTFTSYSNSSANIVINGTSYGAGCSYSGEVEHNGSGGYNEINQSGGCSYAGSFITNDGNGGSLTISTPIGLYAYETWTGNEWLHDGSGGYYSVHTGVTTYSNGAFIGNDPNGGYYNTEVPNGNGNYFTYYTWSSRDYFYNGSLGYYSQDQNTWSASYGTFITYDGSYNYYWDGYGGFYYI